MKILLGDRELKLNSASVLRTMDTGADEWNCVVPWQPGVDKEFDELAKPRSLAPATVSIQGKKLITGNKYITVPGLTKKGQQLTLGGYSKTIALIRSNPKNQKEFLNSSLLDITREFTLTFGIFTASDVDAEVNEKFENEKIGAQDKIFSFLQNLARQRGILVSSTENGDILYLKANVNQEPVGSITEGDDGSIPVTENYSARFDDTEAFRTYQAVNDSPYSFSVKEPQAKTIDERIKVPSFKTIVTNSLIKGAGQKAVEFARNQTLAKTLSIPFLANSWNAPDGTLWKENTLVSVVSPTLFVPNGFTFLIRAVEYTLDGRGETAVLWLVPPSLYTGEPIIEPW